MSFAQILRDSQFAKLVGMSRKQLDELASKGNNVLMEGVAWMEDMELPKLAKGWQVAYAGKREYGYRGDIVLLPHEDEAARRCYLDGQFTLASEAGLSKEHANLWANSSVSGKHATLKTVVAILASPALKEAYAAYNPKMMRNDEIAWRRQHNVTDRHTAMERKAIKEMLRIFDNPEVRRERERAKKYAGAPLSKKIPGVVNLDVGWKLILTLGAGIHLPFTFAEYSEEHKRRADDGIYLTEAEIRALMAQVHIDHARGNLQAPAVPRSKEERAEAQRKTGDGVKVAPGAKKRGPKSTQPATAQPVAPEEITPASADEEKNEAIKLALQRQFDSLQVGDLFTDAQGFRWAKVSYDSAKSEVTNPVYAKDSIIAFRDDEVCWPDIIWLDDQRYKVSDLKIECIPTESGLTIQIDVPDDDVEEVQELPSSSPETAVSA